MRRTREGAGGSASPESVVTEKWRPPSPCHNEDDATPRQQWSPHQSVSRATSDGGLDYTSRRENSNETSDVAGGQAPRSLNSPVAHVDLEVFDPSVLSLADAPMYDGHPKEPSAPRGSKHHPSPHVLMPPPGEKLSSLSMPQSSGRRATASPPPWSNSMQSDTSIMSPKEPMASPGAMRELGRVRKGHWKKGRPIGAGTCGNVYLGMNEDTGELMAVKEITLETHERRLRGLYTEIQVMHRLVHPHIVGYLGAELQDSQRTLCIFQEWVPAGSLHSLLEQFGALAESTTRLYMGQLLDGLTYLHANRVIHRDIKAKNILVDDRGNVKLADFGCAMLLKDDNQAGEVEMSMKGTPLYMAPEILLKRKCGRRVDVWSLGCAVVEMATTRPPWSSAFQHPYDMIEHFNENPGPPPLPEDLPAGMLDFLGACFTWDPELRPTAQELLAHPYVQGTDPYCVPPVLLAAGGSGAEAGPGGEDEVPLEQMDQHSAVQRMRRCSSATFDILAAQARQVALGAGPVVPPLASAGATTTSSAPGGGGMFRPSSPRRATNSFAANPRRTPTRRRVSGPMGALAGAGAGAGGGVGGAGADPLGRVSWRGPGALDLGPVPEKHKKAVTSPVSSPAMSISPQLGRHSVAQERQEQAAKDGGSGGGGEGCSDGGGGSCKAGIMVGVGIGVPGLEMMSPSDTPPPTVRPLSFRHTRGGLGTG